MKQFYAHYNDWEDYKHGMYSGSMNSKVELIEKAKEVLSDSNLFYNTLQKVIVSWPIATKVNMTNKGTNRRSWLGHAACSYLHNVPEVITRLAWGELDESVRFSANTVAEKVISEYETNYLNA